LSSHIAPFANAKLGYFPVKWKKSIIIMIAKPGKDYTIIIISLLYCISKIFKKCVLTRINTYLRIQDRILSHKFGFREKHGTIEQVNHAHFIDHYA